MQNLIADKTRRANRRLRDLERSGLSDSSNAYRYVKRLVYDGDRDNTTDVSSTGKIKFRTDIKNMSFTELKKQLSVLDSFLTSKTSTVGGIKRKYEQAYDSFKKSDKDNENVSFEDYIEMYDSKALVEFQLVYGSKVMQELVQEYGIDIASQIASEVLKENKKRKEEISLEEIERIKSKFKKGK